MAQDEDEDNYEEGFDDDLDENDEDVQQFKITA